MILEKNILDKSFTQVKCGDPNAKEYLNGEYYIYYVDSTYIIGIKTGKTLFVGKIENDETLVSILKSIGL